VELRQRGVDAYLRGEGSIRELAECFAVSPHFVMSMVTRSRRTGSVTPRPHGGGGKKLGPAGGAVLRALVADDPDATLRELRARLRAACRVTLTEAGVCLALQRLGLPRKKSRSARPSRTAPTYERRARPSAAGSSATTLVPT